MARSEWVPEPPLGPRGWYDVHAAGERVLRQITLVAGALLACVGSIASGLVS